MSGQEQPYVEETPTPSDGSQPEDLTWSTLGKFAQDAQ